MNIKSQHVEHEEDHRQVLPAMAEIMFKMMSLILEGVERFIFDLPARPAAFNQMTKLFFVNGKVSDPAVPVDDLPGCGHQAVGTPNFL